MKKTRLTALMVLTVLLSVVLLACADPGVKQNDDASAKQVTAEACYSDGFSDFDSLVSMSGLIVRVTVDSVSHAASFTQSSLVTVRETYVGKTDDVICIVQMNDSHALIEGREYILFLNPQTTDIDVRQYYCVGGGLGNIRVDEEHKMLVLGSDIIKGDSLSKWLKKNTSYSKWTVA